MTAPTSEERREVASALRGDPRDTLIPQSRDGFAGMTYHEAAYRFWNMCRRVRDAADVDIAYSTTSVLADLMDPTCEVEAIATMDWPEGTGTTVYELSCGHSCETTRPVAPDYCPRCGTRVVDDHE